MQALEAEGYTHYLELGNHPILAGAAARCLAEADPPCPWYAWTEARAKAHFGEAEVASW